MKKRILSLLLTIIMITSLVPSLVHAENDTETTRYTVLVLDTSGSADFLGSSGQTIYTANTAVEYVKQSANKFAEDILKANGTNYVAVVSYKATAQKTIDFTNNGDLLKQNINSLSSSSSTRDIAAGLKMARDLISTIEDDNAIKNVVLVTTGMTNEGEYNYSGHYDESTVGSNWRRMDNGVRLYAYANVAYSIAESIKEDANLYTLGIFQTMNNMPDEGKEIAEFFRLTALDLATSNDFFYDIENPEDIEFVFGEIANDITMEDSDGDGLYDDWETNGVDIDNDGIIDLHLEQMGANPNVPDIFVEVDWMVQPQKKVLFVETQPELSLAPSQESMRIVYNSFKEHGINIHIDAGPDSIDFVTGKTWGNLSGGNQITYEENFELGNDYSHWSDVVENNFDTKNRGNIFRHAMFINTYNGGTSSGIANGIPGQYFIIANQSWVRKTGNTGIAGTFMHELGHTLGLSHGGHDHNNGNNHTHYKPNYLSIMNYLFQTSGLVGTNEVNYSEYSLPDLNENYLIEQNGIDPAGLTEGTGLGTKIKEGSFWGFDKDIVPISRTSVDYNNLWGIDRDPVEVDLNADGTKEILTSSNDWEHLIYKGGDIGERKQIINIAGIDGFSDEEKLMLAEVDLEERLENGLLANEGTGAIEAIGPFTLLEGYDNQETIVRVSNLSTKDTTFNLVIEKNDIVDEFSKEIEIKGSTNEISYVDIKIPIINAPNKGNYLTKAVLKNATAEDIVINFNLNVYSPTDEELEELKNLLLEEDEQIPEYIQDEYKEVLGEYKLLILSTSGGKIVGSTNKFADETDVVEIEAKANSGYTFTGWTSSNGGTFEDANNLKTKFTMPANDTTITANFKKKSSGGGGTSSYTIKFETNGGNKVSNKSVRRNNTLTEPTAPTKDGFTFEGWYTDKDLTTKYDFSAKVTKGFTLYAKWEDIKKSQIILTIGDKDALVFGETKENDVAPKIVNDRTMLPIRFIAEALGAEVKWDGLEQKVTIVKDDIEIVITIDSDKAIVNGKTITLDSSAFIENDRTYLPLRFISENLGAKVEWVEDTQQVIITK